MYRGRYSLGQEIPLGVLTVNADGTPTLPTTAPHMDIFSSSAKVLEGKLIPIIDRGGQTGYFQYPLFLGPLFAAGRYSVIYRYLVGSYLGQVEDVFEVLAGDDEGAVIAMYWYERPHAAFVVQQLDSGLLVRGRNPRL